MSSLVSICIPTYNGARWIRESIRSALDQTHERLEILVVDDRSTDNTLDIVSTFQDHRVRVTVNERNLGIVGNRNRCIRLSKGSFVKFLFQDDLLYPDCVEKMVRLFDTYEQVGMVFAPRDIILENPDDPIAVAWKKRHHTLHARFKGLAEFNRGIDLFEQWLTIGFRQNWVGEPSNVMLRKSCLDQVGLFNTRMRACSDYEMWIRMMYFYDVGFVNEPLSAFRVHSASASSIQARQNRSWLDMMWLLEGLLAHDEICENYPQIKRLRCLWAGLTMIQQALRILRGGSVPILYMIGSLNDYFAYLAQSMSHSAPSIHG